MLIALFSCAQEEQYRFIPDVSFLGEISELSSEYALSKLTITGWIKKNKIIAIDKNTIVATAEFQAMLKKNKQLEEEIEILKKAMGIFARK